MVVENSKESATAGKIIRCKAAISRGPEEALVIEEIEVEPPKAWEVRIKILCTSLCHSDVTFWKMKEGPFTAFPRILGHESVGVVESVGDYVEYVKEGDTVLPMLLPDCGECRNCKSANSNICCKYTSTAARTGMLRDGTSRFRDLKGQVLNHFLNVSTFTEYTVIDVANVVKISHEIPVEKACLLSCGVSTGVGAAYKVAGVEKGSTVAIFGLGTIGLAVAEGSRMCGASKIIGVDLNPEKFEIGKKFGLTDFINPKTCGEKPVSEVLMEMTDGGVDYSFECIGIASLMEEAFSSTREGTGKTVILGLEMQGKPMIVDPTGLLGGRSICGCQIGGLKPKSDISFLVQKYMNKELTLDPFVTHEVGLNDINKAFELLHQGKSLRCVIWMDK